MRAIIFMLCLCWVSASWAAVIHLKDGRIIQGDIVEQNAQAIRVAVNGGVMTYFADEIGDVNGTPFGEIAKQENIKKIRSEKPAQKIIKQAVPTVQAPISPEKRALIVTFMETFGTKKSLENNFSNLVKQAQAQRPQEAEKIKSRIKVDELVEELIPVYDRNFSQDDLKAMIEFYRSSAGQKMAMVMPVLVKESIEASTRYIQRKFPDLAD